MVHADMRIARVQAQTMGKVAVPVDHAKPTETPLGLPTFSSPTLRERVYAGLRQAIADRRLAPGTLINEGELATSFSVSRSPIREAVQQLHSDRLVTRRANGRYMVAVLSDDELRNLYAVRACLEGLASQEAAGKMTATELDALEALIGDERKAAEDRDLSALLDIGTKLHRFLAACCGNPELQRMVYLLLDRVKPFTVVSTSLPERTTTVVAEHSQLLAAFQRRDAFGARSTMEEHIGFSRDRLLRR